MMELAYLKSYTDMGQASVVCAWGCRCADTLLEGHHSDKTSQVGWLVGGVKRRPINTEWRWCTPSDLRAFPVSRRLA